MCWSAAALRLLHDADTAVELALGVVVDVGIGVAAAHVGGGHGVQAAGVVGATVLNQDVNTLLAPGSPRVRQGRLAACVPALHIHTILQKMTMGVKQREQREDFTYVIFNTFCTNIFTSICTKTPSTYQLTPA